MTKSLHFVFLGGTNKWQNWMHFITDQHPHNRRCICNASCLCLFKISWWSGEWMAEYLFCVETKLNCDLRHFISSVCAGEVNSVDLVVINIICEGLAPVDTE